MSLLYVESVFIFQAPLPSHPHDPTLLRSHDLQLGRYIEKIFLFSYNQSNTVWLMLCHVIDYRAAETITVALKMSVILENIIIIMPVVRLLMVHDRLPHLLRFMQFPSAFAAELY